MKKICIALAAVLLIAAGALAVFAFGGESVYQARSYKYAEVKTAVIVKNYNGNYSAMTEAESDAVVNHYDGFEMTRVYSDTNDGITVKNGGFGNEAAVESYYYSYRKFSGCVATDKNLLETYGFELTAGKLPLRDNELCITLYEFELYKYYGYKRGNKTETIAAYTDIIGKIININEIDFTITGIIDTGLGNRFDSMKDDTFTENIQLAWFNIYNINEHNALYLSPTGAEDLFEFLYYSIPMQYLESYDYNTAPQSLAGARGAEIVWAEGTDELNSDGIILSKEKFRRLMYTMYGDYEFGHEFEGERYAEEALDDDVLKAMLDAVQNLTSTAVKVNDEFFIKGYWDNKNVLTNYDAVISDAVYAYKTEEYYAQKVNFVTSILVSLGKKASVNAELFEAYDMGGESVAIVANSVYEPLPISRRTIEQIAFGAAIAGSIGFLILAFKKKRGRNKW